jgi:hypothetical protein
MDKRIHLLGFAQGGTVAAEFVLEYWKRSIRAAQERGNDGDELAGSLGSVISISGPLISYPTLSKPTSTPLLIFHRPPPSQSALLPADLKALQKAYTAVTEVNGGNGEGMPRSKEEWEPIMRFWSTKLGRRLGEDLYEFMGGRAP